METTPSFSKIGASEPICVNCGHPKSDHPMFDACWHTVEGDKKKRLCACRGYKSPLQARAASVQDSHA